MCAPNRLTSGDTGYSGKAVDMWSIGCIASALISGDVFYVDRAHPELEEYPNRVILGMARNVNLAVLDEHPKWKHEYISKSGCLGPWYRQAEFYLASLVYCCVWQVGVHR